MSSNAVQSRDPLRTFSDWKLLQHHLGLGSLSFIDVFFAKRVLDHLGSKEESQAAFLAVLFALSRNGHLVLDLSEKGLAATWDLLTISSPEALETLVKKGAESFPVSLITQDLASYPSAWVVRSGSLCYLQRNWVYESQVLFHLNRLSQMPPTLELSPSSLNSALNEQQQEAIIKAVHHSVSFLTGGPGTGKTFTAAHLVKACVSALEHPEQFRVVLMAPTGKAAFQLESSLRNILSSTLQMRAGTLHALLGVRSSHESALVPLFADLILVDESSMIDVRLFARLLSSIHEGSRVVFIGDKDQLPPVEAGSVFADLLESNRCPSTELQLCLRSDSNAILSLALAMRQGDAEKAFALLSEGSAWIDLETKDPSVVLKELGERFASRFLHLFSEAPSEESLRSLLGHFALLSCVRQGPLGVDAVNLYCLHQLLCSVGSAAWMAIPVMVTTNDYELGLYNGDQGILCCRTSSNPLLKRFDQEDYLLFGDRKISPWAIPSFALSYCVSVHKSQGSEYSEVLILVPQGSESFGREVLYTAVTRAKKSVIVASTKELILKAISSSSRKRSGLSVFNG